MKKLLSFFLILVMIFGLSACGEPSFNAREDVNKEAGKELPQDNPIYGEIQDMLEPIAAFVEYNHILNNSIDYNAIGAEDFWNIVAIVVDSYPKISDYAEIDPAGFYHMKWNDMMEFAKTFMFLSWYKNSAPSYKTSYSASADPGSGVIDLIPLSVDNYEGSLVLIEEAKSKNKSYDYILNIDLATPGENPTVVHYHVFLTRWDKYLQDFDVEDNGEHIMPYAVTGYQYLGTDEP